ncbi:MAG: hypothetical protein ACOCQD_02975 [archaeon]
MKKATLFLVPNCPTPGSKFKYPYSLEELKTVQMDVDPNEIYVQVWALNPERDNWADHGLPKSLKKGRTQRNYHLFNFPTFLPASLFAGKDDGDTIILEIGPQKVPVSFQLDQLNTRYSSAGFKDTFERLMNLFDEYHPEFKKEG